MGLLLVQDGYTQVNALTANCDFLLNSFPLFPSQSSTHKLDSKIWHSSKNEHADGGAEHEQGGNGDAGDGEGRARLTFHDFAVGRD